MFKRGDLFPNNSNVESWPRTYLVIVILNLTIAASFYLIPSILGYGWNNSAGESILNVHKEKQRYPGTNITAEPWGASVLLGPAESRLRDYFARRVLPLWNPYQGLGEPYAAQGDGSPYSLPALARALSPPWAGNLITFGVFADWAGASSVYEKRAIRAEDSELSASGALIFRPGTGCVGGRLAGTRPSSSYTGTKTGFGSCHRYYRRFRGGPY